MERRYHNHRHTRTHVCKRVHVQTDEHGGSHALAAPRASFFADLSQCLLHEHKGQRRENVNATPRYGHSFAALMHIKHTTIVTWWLHMSALKGCVHGSFIVSIDFTVSKQN